MNLNHARLPIPPYPHRFVTVSFFQGMGYKVNTPDDFREQCDQQNDERGSEEEKECRRGHGGGGEDVGDAVPVILIPVQEIPEGGAAASESPV